MEHYTNGRKALEWYSWWDERERWAEGAEAEQILVLLRPRVDWMIRVDQHQSEWDLK